MKFQTIEVLKKKRKVFDEHRLSGTTKWFWEQIRVLRDHRDRLRRLESFLLY